MKHGECIPRNMKPPRKSRLHFCQRTRDARRKSCTRPARPAVTRSCRKRQKGDSGSPGCDRKPRRCRREALVVHFAKYEAASENTTTFLPAASSVFTGSSIVQDRLGESSHHLADDLLGCRSGRLACAPGSRRRRGCNGRCCQPTRGLSLERAASVLGVQVNV